MIEQPHAFIGSGNGGKAQYDAYDYEPTLIHIEILQVMVGGLPAGNGPKLRSASPLSKSPT
jgi:hypothetical protein